MVTTLIGCNSSNKAEKFRILCPTGAPSLALVSEYEEISKNGKMDFVNGSDNLVVELSKKDSEYDIIIAPINLGAKLIENNQTNYRLHSVITWGNLYLVGSSQEALNLPGEIALFGQGSVPQKIYETCNIETSLTPTYYNDASGVQQVLLSNKASVGLLAEPAATATIAKAKENGLELSIIKDLQSEYATSKQGYPQAAIFVKGDKSYDHFFEEIDAFTNHDYPDLQKHIETVGIETLNLPSVEIAVKTIQRQNIHYKKAHDVKEDIANFLKLFNITYSDDMLVDD